MNPSYMDTVKATRQKTEKFVANLGAEQKSPITVMALGMMAGQILGELAAKQNMGEEQLDDLILSFAEAFAKSTREYYNGRISD